MNTHTPSATPKPILPGSTTQLPRPVDSASLLGSCCEIEITHQGETYRLRRTRQGKLILTK